MATSSTTNSRVDSIRIKCGVSANYAFMRGLLEDFLPQGQGFVLDVLVPMRSRTVGNGKCCWCAYYVSTLIPIPTKSDFLNAKKTLTLNKPFDAEIVCFGRYAEQGICITYCNVKCCCVKDFSHVLTQFPLEPRKEKNYSVTGMYTDEEEIQWTELLLEVAPSNSTGILAPGTLEAEIDCGTSVQVHSYHWFICESETRGDYSELMRLVDENLSVAQKLASSAECFIDNITNNVYL